LRVTVNRKATLERPPEYFFANAAFARSVSRKKEGTTGVLEQELHRQIKTETR